ncbi:butyrophilin subfamily 2 member A2-like [Diorhabda carinulata]|nr:butyrophilin subfamily 2 member A2-like [Diorhabda carinulata]
MKLDRSLNITIFIILIVSVNVGIGVRINRLEVPEVTRHGSPVILDCDFSLEANDQDLVVKWFFNKTLVYQWIPGTKKRPQGLGILKDRLNLEYAASVDANSIHRALHILKAGPDLSGDYTCSVSTLQSEDIETKSMLVLVSGKELILRKLSAEEGMIKVQCLAEGVYPMPLIILDSRVRNITETDIISRRKGQLFEVSAIVTLPALEVPEVFSCKLLIPQANYTTRREIVFYPGNSGNLNSNRVWFTVAAYLISTTLGFTITYIGC